MAHFTPYSALLGGSLIGLAAAILLLFNGRVAGISGIFGGLVHLKSHDWAWRLAFFTGLLLAPLLFSAINIGSVMPQVNGTWLRWAVAGLLVGYGTRLAKGCTSGHGVCGLARLSKRSLIATLIFMAVAFLVVYVDRHLII